MDIPADQVSLDSVSGFQALSCSLLVSTASLICLILLLILFVQGKPVVDSSAFFVAGAMLGDGFLHQLPHAFGGILLFLIFEKLVRYVEDKSGGARLHHHHHHHHHKSSKKLNHGNDPNDIKTTLAEGKNENRASTPSEGMNLNEVKEDSLDVDDLKINGSLRQRKVSAVVTKLDHSTDSSLTNTSLREKESAAASKNLFFGYLNLFSDDVVGDFGILVRSGFNVPKSLFFNFLSALVALAGTVLALLLGQEGGQSSRIEGFIAGWFIYIVVGVIDERMCLTLKSTLIQLTSIVLGMGVALGISIVE